MNVQECSIFFPKVHFLKTVITDNEPGETAKNHTSFTGGGITSRLIVWNKGPRKASVKKNPNPRDGMKSLDSDYPGVCVLSCMVIFRLARRGWEEGCQARLSRRGFSPCPPGNIGLWALNCLWMGVTPVKSFSSLSFRLFTWTPEFKTLSLSSVVLRIK